ncbi:MarR family winged helix-turn-helix transcriptional regulator [Amnibacterium endophyticum]|uniref:MarR family winged helix-turn-helix transcriptional regulator n=1 Tax=Amnibacterium endophyticum TaxID=2109337 RepID=A0ABW4LEX0_9MICO
MATDDAIRTIEGSFERIAVAARRAGRSIAQRFDPELQPAAWAVLRELLRGGPMQPHALAAAMSMDRSAISRLLKELRERGLIEAERDEQDGRSQWISVTPAARARAEAVLADRRQRLHEHLSAWDEGDLDRFAVLLDRFADPEWLSET